MGIENTIYYKASEKLDTRWVRENSVSHIFSNGKGQIQLTNYVTEIGRSAFENCKTITSIIIPDSIKKVGERAFARCGALSSIMIPNSVTEIDFAAFGDCGLESIIIPNSCKKIGDHAFSPCKNLRSVVVANSVTEIAYLAFGGCSSLASIMVAKGNPKYDSRNNCNAIIETSTNMLHTGCKNTVIPNSVKEIGWGAFTGSGLKSIVIPDSVTKIASNAFSACKNLESIVIDKHNPRYDSRNNCNAIIETKTNVLLDGCKNTVIPNTVTKIGDGFFVCTGLTSIIIPNSVTEIGGAFYGCDNLESVVIPDSVKKISICAFQCCSKLKTPIPKHLLVSSDTSSDNQSASSKNIGIHSSPCSPIESNSNSGGCLTAFIGILLFPIIILMLL